jgi:cytochrome c peroxidase
MKWLLLVAAGMTLRVPLGLDSYVPAPAENPLTAEKVALGRRLFFDKRLSRDATLSCGTCHEPKRAFADGLARARGVEGKTGPRRSPRILNRAWGKSFFWDGRAKSLEEQVTQPIENPLEMDMKVADVVARLRKTGEYPGLDELVLRRALASYVRTILSGNSAYDRYLAGDAAALGEAARRGLAVFRGKGNCISCHLGPNLTDEDFHVTGACDGSDPGRGGGAFKTPGLRNVAEAAPYFHDGSAKGLAEVIEHYDRGGKKVPGLDAEMMPLGLSVQEKLDLEAFLRALSGDVQEGWRE